MIANREIKMNSVLEKFSCFNYRSTTNSIWCISAIINTDKKTF